MPPPLAPPSRIHSGEGARRPPVSAPVLCYLSGDPVRSNLLVFCSGNPLSDPDANLVRDKEEKDQSYSSLKYYSRIFSKNSWLLAVDSVHFCLKIFLVGNCFMVVPYEQNRGQHGNQSYSYPQIQMYIFTFMRRFLSK